MEVHPPEHPIHTPRDFFLHLFTITIGLLIALSLEAAVERVHQHHLLHTAESNLTTEICDNRKYLAEDEQHLDLTEQHIEAALDTLAAIKAHKSTATDLKTGWAWDGMQSTAWETAHNTGAIALMPYNAAQAYSSIYGQQSSVNAQAGIYIRDIYAISAPLHGSQTLQTLQPSDIDPMIHSAQNTLADLRLLRDYCESLDRIYTDAEKDLQQSH